MLTSALLVCRNSVVEQPLRAIYPVAEGNVVVALKTRPNAPAKSRRVAAWLDELEMDDEFAADVATARRELADEGGPDLPVTMRLLRMRAGLSQKQLALAIGTTQANISRLESGQQQPSFATAAALRRTLVVSFETLAEAMQLA